MPNAQVRFADALQRVFPTTVVSYLEFRGWIHQDTRCNGMSVAVFRNRSIEAMRGRTNCR